MYYATELTELLRAMYILSCERSEQNSHSLALAGAPAGADRGAHASTPRSPHGGDDHSSPSVAAFLLSAALALGTSATATT